MANGYEPVSTELLPERFTLYKKLLSNKINNMKLTQNYLDNSGFPFSNAFLELRERSDLQFVRLNGENQIEYTNTTMHTA